MDVSWEKTTIMTPGVLFLLFLLFLLLAVVPLGEAQEIEDVTENIAKTNEKSISSLIDGDVKLSKSKNAAFCTSSSCKWPKRSKYVYIPYNISSLYIKKERRTIISALKSFRQSTCVRLVRRRRKFLNARDYLYIFPGDGCWSYIGRIGGKQRMSLMRNGCVHKGIVQHEVLHALGFHHEQARSDRDSFVNILTENIQSGKESNFNKRTTNNLGTPYDFQSIMHYGKFAFSKNGSPTILAKTDPSIALGSNQMSNNDIERINKLYNCCE